MRLPCSVAHQRWGSPGNHLHRSGFKVRDFGTALIAAMVLGLANAALWPLLMLLALPLNLMTLGLFTFVVSAVLLMLTSALVKGFQIDGWIPAILGAVVIALVTTILRTVVL